MSELTGGIALVGAGLLADAIARDLGPHGAVYRVDRTELATIPGDCRAVVVAGDGWDAGDHPDVRKACADREVPWLPVRTELGRVVVGPVVCPNTPGCAGCADLRRRSARHDTHAFDAVWNRHSDTIRRRPSSLLTCLSADLVAGLVQDELLRLAADPDSVRTRSALVYIDLKTLRATAHRFLPDPLCPECGDLPDDDAASAVIELQPRPKPATDRYRIRPVVDELDTLRRTYVDAECGIVRELQRGSEGGLAAAAAPMGRRNGREEHGFGRSRSYRVSELTALLEALERYGGLQPGGKRTVVQAGYREVAAEAVDPRTLGLHADDSYEQPGFPVQPFDEDRRYRWVWGYSFARQAPILVPEACAYYYRPVRADEPRHFTFESSNGCALGTCLEEAILYGILEVAERDAFLMTWYTQMQVPRVDPRSARNRTIPMMAGMLAAETGYQTMIFDITLEQGIPSFWVMAVDPVDEPHGPKVMCTAGAHPNPETAVEGALSELAPIVTSRIRTYRHEHARARAMAADPALVREMADHSILNGDPAVFGRFSFLTDSTKVRAIADLPRPTGFGNTDLSDDLRQLVGRYLDHGMDVIVVDQTSPEHRAGGFSCVKVIIPGTLPMTFGHHFRRIEGLPRLYEVPHLLGYRDRRLGPADINLHPHPFP
jgi:ribosomal protein S12 methylthiotransferase accessory factor